MATKPKAAATKSLDDIINAALAAPPAGEGEQDYEKVDAFRFEEPGDKIAGIVDSIGSHDAGYGTYPIVTVTDKETGEKAAIHGLGTVLKDKLEDALPGDLVIVRYDGDRKSKNNRSYKSYTVKVVEAKDLA